MTAELPTILLPGCHAANLICRRCSQGVRPLRAKEDQHPSVPVVSEKSLTKSDGDQRQAEEVPANTNRHFPNSLKTRKEPLFLLPDLQSLTLSNWNSRNEANRPHSSRLLGQGTEMYF